MNDDDRSKLGELYPKAKSYAELKYERKLINELRRPKRVAIRIAGYVTVGIMIGLLAIYAMFAIMSNNLSSTGQVLSLVCIGILIGLAAMAALFYIGHTINQLVSKVLISSGIFYVTQTALLMCAIGTIIVANNFENQLLIFIVLAANFTVSTLVTELILRSQARAEQQ